MENALSTSIATEEFTLFLQHLESLGISIEQKEMLQKLFSLYRGYNFSVEDCAELAFARLRATTIEIVCPLQYQNFFSIAENEDAPDFQELSPISLVALEQRLFDQLGIISPKLVLTLHEEVEALTMKLNDNLLVLSVADEASTSLLTETIYNILVQHASQLLDSNDVEYHLAQLHPTYPVLVQATLMRFTLGEITRVLRNEVRKAVSILDIRFHLERMLDSTFTLPEERM